MASATVAILPTTPTTPNKIEDVAQIDVKPVSEPIVSNEDSCNDMTYDAYDEQLTVKEMLDFLQHMVEKNPAFVEMPIYHIEFGGLEQSITININRGRLIIS